MGGTLLTPGARVAAAIDIVDRIAGGAAAEQALLSWARGARYAGSKDRAAVRDLVFDTLRRWWSSAARGGGETGRRRVIGCLAGQGLDPAAYFTGEGHAPDPLEPDEAPVTIDADTITALDCPDWMAPTLRRSLGDDFIPVLGQLRHRAPVFLRVNLRRCDLAGAQAALAGEGIETRPHPLSPTALEVLTRPRAVAGGAAFRDGLVELQDVASQAVVDMLPLDGCDRILDYCAGGGGKALAIAGRRDAKIDAHDAAPERMNDLPARADRAGVRINRLKTEALGQYDLVLVDAPCSGSGAWRRAPEGKLRLRAPDLERLADLQDRILRTAADRVVPGGALAYATCSLCDTENEARIAAFLRDGPFRLEAERRFSPLEGGDGFYCAVLRRQ